jgi:signal transduction histidine kinase
LISRLREPRRLRNRLLAAVLLAVAFFLGALTVGFNVILATRLNHDANDLLRSRAAAALGSVRISGQRLVVPETPDEAVDFDRPVWIFGGSRLLEHPEAGRHLLPQARALAAGPVHQVDVDNGSARMLAIPVNRGGRRIGSVVVAESLVPYRHTRHEALVGSIALAAALLVAVALAARWLLGAGLRPVARMTAQAAEWSERDLDRRFALGPPRDEFTQLAATLDGLLDRLAAGLRRERRFSAELSHELRTPLARVRAQAQLALADEPDPRRAEAWTAVLRSTDEMARTLEALLLAARAEGGQQTGRADAQEVARAVTASHEPMAAEHRVSIELVAPGPAMRVDADGELVKRILHPLVDNACRYAASSVRVDVSAEDGVVLFGIADDGPGVRAEERETIFEPAVRGSAQTASPSGAGLGLALARRLARSAGGDVAAESGTGGRFVVRLPRA